MNDFEKVYPGELRAEEAKLIRQRRDAAALEKDGTAADEIGSGRDSRIGLALSGGGIRSATFSLGVLQALAEKGLLRRFDFMSTVSGGGYVGGYLGRLFTRFSKEETKDPVSAVESEVKNSESQSLRYLRDNGRYLSPNGGGDTWKMAAVFLRNWVSVQTVMFVFVLGVFLFFALLRALAWDTGVMSWMENTLLIATKKHLWWSPLLALPVLTTVLLVIPAGWAFWMTQSTWAESKVQWFRNTVGVLAKITVVLFLVGGLAWSWHLDWKIGTGAVIAGEAALTLLLYWIARGVAMHGGAENWRSADLIVRDTLSKFLASALALTLALLVLALIDSLGQSLYALLREVSQWTKAVQMMGGVAGISGAVLIARKLMVLMDRLPKKRAVQLPLELIITVMAVVFATVLLTLVSAGAHAIAWRGAAPAPEVEFGNACVVCRPGHNLKVQIETTDRVQLSAENYVQVVAQVEPPRKVGVREQPDTVVLGVAFGACVLVSLLFGHTIAFVNLSSFHSFYTARLVQAYLGASNKDRRFKEGANAAHRVGEAVPSDDVRWSEYHPWKTGGPLHLVNVTLNETVSGKTQIEYRDRKGLIMSVGPAGLTVGVRDHALWIGKAPEKDRPFVEIEPLNTRPGQFHALGIAKTDADPGIYAKGAVHACEEARLGRWVGISGAAFSTGLGAGTSLGKSLLLGLFNVRLGFWWTAGIRPEERTEAKAITPPTFGNYITRVMSELLPVQSHLFQELTARFHGPVLKRWYLTDGGHFENTAVYELLRRRVPFIVASDNGCDADFNFEDVANLVRKARIDFGAEVSFVGPTELAAMGATPELCSLVGTPEDFLIPAKPGDDESTPHRAKAHAVLARVSYSGLGGDTPDRQAGATGAVSYVLFLKPSITGDEPLDVMHYQKGHQDFPNESTADQYFDEAQWESYRRLGYHIGSLIFQDFRNQRANGGKFFWQPRDLCPPAANTSSGV